jgi:hypothetical protein
MMRDVALFSILCGAGVLVLSLIASGTGLIVWRGRLIRLMRAHYPEALDVAMTSPDVISQLGRPMVSADRILKALDAAVPKSLQDPTVRAVAIKLKISKSVLLVCVVVLICLALLGRFMPKR